MKSNIFFIILAVITICNTAYAQSNNETISVPLTAPGQPGTLDISLHDGSVTIEGYNGSEVLLNITSSNKRDGRSTGKAGLKRIPNNSLDINISEEDNKVYISGTHSKKSDFVIKVPKNFSLNIQTHHNGVIYVSNVSGDIDAKGHHGGITLKDISGSAVAETHHGAIVANFLSVTSKKHMGFSTYHGDVDITFPSSISNRVKMKTTKGDILTDFDMTLEDQKVERETSNGKNQIKLSGWTYGTIGGGGKEIMFTSYHGDILIRKG